MLISHVNKAIWFSHLQAIQQHKQYNITHTFKYVTIH